MSKSLGLSAQGTKLTIEAGGAGTIGPFGGTRIRSRRVYNNADTTTTYDDFDDSPTAAWDEHISVTRGNMIEVEVPFKDDSFGGVGVSYLEDYFDTIAYDTDSPTAMFLTLEKPNGDIQTGYAILQEHEVEMAAKDACRLRFTALATGGWTY